MADVFVIKKGATTPSMVVQLSWTGGPTDLTDATGIIKLRHQFGHEFEKAVTILDQSLFPKKFEVPWTDADVADFHAHLGTYYAEYHITFQDGKLGIFPTEGEVNYDRVEVQPSLAAGA